ncbi:hypothetical protein GZH46_00485 [Fragariocoptes setiger]|uniref:Uncharacterized protein n=1 Tax=Fragariocoptes setiger TaxID=1670756 RepID=A0ABQ7SC01_9ACAR|nr:hypothetical protein GZH46_00485 [Fragariocoptes setiger]
MPVSKVRDLLAEAISAVVDNYLYAGRSPDPEPETDDLDFTDIYTSDAEKRDMISDKSFLANIHKYREHENWTDIKKLAEHPVHVPIWSLDSNERHMRRYLEPAYLIDGTLYDPTNATVANQSVYIDSRTHYNGAWHKKTSADNSTMARSDELECLMRKYTYKAVNTDGRGHKCWGLVTAVACYGRCDSSELKHDNNDRVNVEMGVSANVRASIQDRLRTVCWRIGLLY